MSEMSQLVQIFQPNNGLLHLDTVSRRPQFFCLQEFLSNNFKGNYAYRKKNLVQSSEDLKLLSFMKSVETPHIFLSQTLPVLPRICI